MALVKELYNPVPMTVNATYVSNGNHVSGFLAATVGNITITDASGEVLLASLPLVVGFNRIPLLFRSAAGGTIVLGGGASGTLLT